MKKLLFLLLILFIKVEGLVAFESVGFNDAAYPQALKGGGGVSVFNMLLCTMEPGAFLELLRSFGSVPVTYGVGWSTDRSSQKEPDVEVGLHGEKVEEECQARGGGGFNREASGGSGGDEDKPPGGGGKKEKYGAECLPVLEESSNGKEIVFKIKKQWLRNYKQGSNENITGAATISANGKKVAIYLRWGYLDDRSNPFVVAQGEEWCSARNRLYNSVAEGQLRCWSVESARPESKILVFQDPEEVFSLDQVDNISFPELDAQGRGSWYSILRLRLEVVDEEGREIAVLQPITFRNQLDTIFLDGNAMDGWHDNTEWEKHIEESHQGQQLILENSMLDGFIDSCRNATEPGTVESPVEGSIRQEICQKCIRMNDRKRGIDKFWQEVQEAVWCGEEGDWLYFKVSVMQKKTS